MDKVCGIAALALLFLSSVHAQDQEMTRSLTGAANPLIQQMVDAVSADNIVNNIRGLQGFGTRYEYDSRREAAANWIVKELSWWGVRPESDWYDFGTRYFSDVDIVNQDSAWVVGGDILATTDGGQTWWVETPRVSSGYYYLYGIDFVDSRIGWAVGYNGTLLHTTDGGAYWYSQYSGVTNYLYDVAFANEDIGIVVGSGGTVLRTTDGGMTWMTANAGTADGLLDVTVLDSLNAWAVGYGGTIIHSSDAGLSWSRQSSGVNTGVFGIDFVNAQLGWAVAAGDVVLKTTNGGAIWARSRLDVSSANWGSNPRGLCFADSMHGWMTDCVGGVLRTTDGGGSWTRMNALGKFGWNNLRRIKQFGGQYLLACGQNTSIVTSTDSGMTWVNRAQNLPANYFWASRNIVVTIPGVVTPEKECVMVAHYDCGSGSPGADDNGSGTSAVMESARILKDYQFGSTIKLIAVSGEELGMMGSGESASEARSQGRNIVGVINGDMVGYPISGDTTRLVLGSFMGRNPLVDSALVYNGRYRIGATLVTFIDSTAASDYGPFAMAGYDALDVAEGTPQEIWGGGNPHYHKASDSLVYLHAGLMRRAAQLMLATVAELAGPIGKVTVPSTFALEQNFPNPFNSGTTIRFTVPQSSHVELKIYDILGREVATLLAADLDGGSHSVTWRPENLSSGVYFCRVMAGSFHDTKKMLLLK